MLDATALGRGGVLSCSFAYLRARLPICPFLTLANPRIIPPLLITHVVVNLYLLPI